MQQTDVATLAEADRRLRSSCEAALKKMAARLEPSLPGIVDAVAGTTLLVRFAPGEALGQFAFLGGEDGLHEIRLNADRSQGHFGGQRPGEDAVVTLAHELAHLYAAATGVSDTEPTTRHHNQEFARIARLAGCEVVESSHSGYATPTLSPSGQTLFSDLIPDIDRAFRIYEGLRSAERIAARPSIRSASAAPLASVRRPQPVAASTLVDPRLAAAVAAADARLQTAITSYLLQGSPLIQTAAVHSHARP
jgi:SprT-like family.